MHKRLPYILLALANAFCSKVPRVVLCREHDYSSALVASALSARLRAPRIDRIEYELN